MSEYIEKQDATKFINDCLLHEDKLQSVEKETLLSVKTMIEAIPTADVRPVVRGRWVKVGGFFTPGGDPVWQCSECGKGRHVYGVEHGTYGADVSDGQWLACPNCMADMRGDDG